MFVFLGYCGHAAQQKLWWYQGHVRRSARSLMPSHVVCVGRSMGVGKRGLIAVDYHNER